MAKWKFPALLQESKSELHAAEPENEFKDTVHHRHHYSSFAYE